jgi:hypothetical protein
MSPVEYLPIHTLSAIHRPGSGAVFVAIQAYFDGSGKTNRNSRSKYLTLAGYAGPPEAWLIFEDRWQAVLNRHGSGPLHMSDANLLIGDFKGWTTAFCLKVGPYAASWSPGPA